MNIEAHKLSLIEAMLGVNDAKMLSRVETFIRTEITTGCEKKIVPMTMEEYHAEIDRSLEDYHAGRVISHDDLKKRCGDGNELISPVYDGRRDPAKLRDEVLK
jgi:hypothetical protein